MMMMLMGFLPYFVLFYLNLFFMDNFQDFCMLTWNIRGAVSSTAKRVVKDLLRKWKPDIVILVESLCIFSSVDLFWKRQGTKPCLFLKLLVFVVAFGF